MHIDRGSIKRWGADLDVSKYLAGELRVALRDPGTRVHQPNEHERQEDSPEFRLARAGQLLDSVVNL